MLAYHVNGMYVIPATCTCFVISLHAPSVPLTVFGAGLVSTLVCERLTRWVGSDGLTLVGCAAIACSSLAIYLLPASHWQWIYAIAVVLGE